MPKLYQTHTLQTIHDNEWYWARGKYEYMAHYGQWRAKQGKDIKSLSSNLNFQIVGPIQKPEDHE